MRTSTRATRLFGCRFANVQPNSGSQANQAVFLALLQPGDAFMGLDLAAGGHLTHGSAANLSGKWFKPVPYTVRREDQLIDMEEVARIARENRPKLIIADEPTTALDVTIQAHILYEAQKLCRESGTALIWITHDLSVVAGLAQSGPMLIGARFVQGLGAAMIVPSTLSTLNAIFVGRQRAIAFAVWGSAIGGMAAVGPLLGGWLVFSHVPDGWSFIGMALIAACGAAGAWLTVQESRGAWRTAKV